MEPSLRAVGRSWPAAARLTRAVPMAAARLGRPRIPGPIGSQTGRIVAETAAAAASRVARISPRSDTVCSSPPIASALTTGVLVRGVVQSPRQLGDLSVAPRACPLAGESTPAVTPTPTGANMARTP